MEMSKGRTAMLLLGILAVVADLLGQGFYKQWPFQDRPRSANQNFADMRIYQGVAPHLHGGFDIGTSGDWVECYNVHQPCSIEVTNLYSYGWFVRAHHGTGNLDDPYTPIDEGAAYIHGKGFLAVAPGQILTSPVQMIHDTTDWYKSHLHLDSRISDSVRDYQNPCLVGSLLNPPDYSDPKIVALYINYEDGVSLDVKNWNFLGDTFSQYFDYEYQGFRWARLGAPNETEYDESDDAHVLVENYETTTFKMVAHIIDEMTTGGFTSAPYRIECCLDTAIPEDCNTPSESDERFYWLEFDTILKKEYHREEEVYHQAQPCSSAMSGEQYYLLYRYDTSPLYCVKNPVVLSTKRLLPGQHRMKLFVRDFAGNTKTADFHFYMLESNEQYVDFCKGFN